jgi:formylmethanofuran dehydrogenase subunit C
MSDVVLTLRQPPSVPLEAPGLRPEALALLAEDAIARLTLWHGNQPVPLGDFFDVRGGHSDRVRVRGDLRGVRELGSGMTSGELTLEGDAGMHVGAYMHGGRLVVEGSVGAWAGAEMTGGTLEVRGDADDHLAGSYPGSLYGARGGVVLVHGSAGRYAAERMRRGVVAVVGEAGEAAGRFMVAGTLLVFGRPGRYTGIGLKRGTLVCGAEPELLPTFRYACTYRPDFVNLYLNRLREAYRFPVDDRFLTGRFRRFGGDYTELGKGEILVWTPS